MKIRISNGVNKKIVIPFIVLTMVLAAGILAWQHFMVPKEEVGVPEEYDFQIFGVKNLTQILV